VVSLVALPHHYRQPSDAFWRITETSVVQRLLPFETTQKAADFLRGTED